MPHKGHTGTSMGGVEKSPGRAARERKRRRRQDERWAARSGEVKVRSMSEEEVAALGPPPLKEPLVGTCREQILQAIASLIARSGRSTFTTEQVIAEMRRRGSGYATSTIQTHVVSRMCSNAPGNHAKVYDDLVRVGRGLYRLKN